LRGRSGIPGTVLERLGSIFFENKNCINKIIIFHAFWEPKRYYSFASGSKRIIPFWFPKGMKNDDFVDAIFIFEKYGP